MSFASVLKCANCGAEYSTAAPIRSCLECDSDLQVIMDLQRVREFIDRSVLEKRTHVGIWKYAELLPLEDLRNKITLGEGETYLHSCDRLGTEIGIRDIQLKNETTCPTGSFIDRGCSVEVSAFRERGYRHLSCSSAGNLTASLSAYAARGQMVVRVFIPHQGSLDLGKFYQILAYDADIEIVGTQEEAEKRADQLGPQWHHVTAYNPFFLEGFKTIAYEICEAMRWSSPDWMVIPMGNGGLISRIWKGLKEFCEIGLIDTDLPRLVGVQTSRCAPIVSALESNMSRIDSAGKHSSTTCDSSVATDIVIEHPTCGDSALRALRESRGEGVIVSDREALAGVSLLARLEGVFAEPAAATTVAALRQLVESGIIDRSDRVVCTITGMGLKYPEIASTLVRRRPHLENILSRVERRKYTTSLGMTKVHILQILANRESYGYEIRQILYDKYGQRISVTSVYQHLNELVQAGLVIQSRIERSADHRIKNYYALTEIGKSVLNHLQRMSTRA